MISPELVAYKKIRPYGELSNANHSGGYMYRRSVASIWPRTEHHPENRTGDIIRAIYTPAMCHRGLRGGGAT